MKYKVTKHSKKMKQQVEKIVKGFDWRKIPWYDKEYLSAMVNDTINAMSYKDTGKSFDQTYPDANDFALFNNQDARDDYENEFYHADHIASHLLNPHKKGRKYWLVWSYSPEKNHK